TQIQLPAVRGVLQLVDGIKPLYAGAAAANVGFDHDGKTQTERGFYRVGGRVDHARLRVGKTKLFQQLELQRFGRFIAKCSLSIDHAPAALLEVGQIVKRVENSLAVPAAVSRRTHSVEDERVVALPVQLSGIEEMLHRVDADEGHVPFLERRKQRDEPVRML